MMMDYKATLNLPQTDFPMKANLPQREPEILARWEREHLYERIQEARRGRPLYVLHDGPPYANGRIHIGHALNKVLKDIVVKSKTMEDYQVPFVPGWDCHGLPIERLLLGAQLLQDLMLDRQPVAVPAGDERHLVVLHRLGLDDDVLEDLVQRVANVDTAVGIRRTIVQHVEGPAAPGLLDALIEVLALPASQDLRLALREIGLHGKVSLGEIQRGLVVHHHGTERGAS